MYSILQPGKATITVMVSENGAIIKPMQLTVVTPSDTPLDVSQERITMQVGDTQDIELSGGLPKYVVSKSNENI
jgi:hypothetical protein